MKDETTTVPDIGDFFYSSPDLLSVFGKDGELILVNPAWKDMLGWDLEELRGVPFADFVHPDDVKATEDEFLHRASAGPMRHDGDSKTASDARDGSYRTIRGVRCARTDGSARRARTSPTARRCSTG